MLVEHDGVLGISITSFQKKTVRQGLAMISPIRNICSSLIKTR